MCRVPATSDVQTTPVAVGKVDGVAAPHGVADGGFTFVIRARLAAGEAGVATAEPKAMCMAIPHLDLAIGK